MRGLCCGNRLHTRFEQIAEIEGTPVLQIDFRYYAYPVMHTVDDVYHRSVSTWCDLQSAGDQLAVRCLWSNVERARSAKVTDQCDPEIATHEPSAWYSQPDLPNNTKNKQRKQRHDGEIPLACTVDGEDFEANRRADVRRKLRLTP